MEYTARQLAEKLGGTVEGNPEETISSLARIESGKPGQLSFYANPKYEEYVYTSRASILLVRNDFVPKQAVIPTLIKVKDPYIAIAQVLEIMSSHKKAYKRHRGRCRIAWSAKLGRKVYVGDFVTIGKSCRIGDYTKIYNNVTIGAGTVIGSNCIIYPGVHIFPGMVIGDRVILHAGCIIGDDGFGNAPQEDGTWKKIEHVGNVVIGNDVEIGSNTTIDRGVTDATVIKDGVRIDNLCQIAHNVVVGENTAMAAMTGIAGSTKLGKNCLLGGQVGIAGHLSIADNTKIAAQSGLIGNVKKPGEVYFGSPAMKYNIFMRAYAKFRRSGQE